MRSWIGRRNDPEPVRVVGPTGSADQPMAGFRQAMANQRSSMRGNAIDPFFPKVVVDERNMY